MVRLMTGDTGHYACRSDAFSTLSTQRADGQRFHSPVLVGIVLVLLRVLDARGDVVSGHSALCVCDLWF